jgi:hypothetical protein
MNVLHLDPCIYVPQGATAQDRAHDRARIIADLQAHADELNRRGGPWCYVVGVPPWMEPTPPWLESIRAEARRLGLDD